MHSLYCLRKSKNIQLLSVTYKLKNHWQHKISQKKHKFRHNYYEAYSDNADCTVKIILEYMHVHPQSPDITVLLLAFVQANNSNFAPLIFTNISHEQT